MSNPFQQPELRDWFFEELVTTGRFPNGVGTMGSGPFEETEFDNFLCKFEIQARLPSPNLNTLVVGREDWDVNLNDVIEARRGKELRVYSQEMFLAYIATSKDPLDSPEVAEIFGDGHPALEYIRDWGFDWPTTRLVPARHYVGSTATPEWGKESFLKIMGYTVGAKGRDVQRRRNVLCKTFTGELPVIADAKYRAEWGPPRSGTRLQKIAERISIDILLHRAQGHREAVNHWIVDLAWLKSEYYDGRHTFTWPDIIV